MLVRVIQVLPTDHYTVYVYFTDGKVKLYDVSPLIEKGIFKQLQDNNIFIDRCNVLNHTLAWDLSGQYDPYNCIDIDPETIYQESVDVPDPMQKAA